MSENAGYAESLRAVLDGLLKNEAYNPIIREIAQELHDGFELILLEAIMSNPGEHIDGAAILAILMSWTRKIKHTSDAKPIVPAMEGLPSQRNYGNRSPD